MGPKQLKGKLMKINVKQTLGIAAVSCLALASSAMAASHGAGNSPGNSGFGHSQAMSPVTGSGNSSFGRTTAANARLKSNIDIEDANDLDRDRDDLKMKKVKKTHTKTTFPGNSAFGRSQRVNHLKGSGNNIYGKTTSANAKLKNANKKNSRPLDRD